MNRDKPYDLEERTYAFALEIRLLLKNMKWDPVSWTDLKQLLRSSGSVAANYAETRGSGLWLRPISDSIPIHETIRRNLDGLISETSELVKIFVTLIRNKSVQKTLP